MYTGVVACMCLLAHTHAPTCAYRADTGIGLIQDLSPGPLAPGARIMPLDQAASWRNQKIKDFFVMP